MLNSSSSDDDEVPFNAAAHSTGNKLSSASTPFDTHNNSSNSRPPEQNKLSCPSSINPFSNNMNKRSTVTASNSSINKKSSTVMFNRNQPSSQYGSGTYYTHQSSAPAKSTGRYEYGDNDDCNSSNSLSISKNDSNRDVTDSPVFYNDHQHKSSDPNKNIISNLSDTSEKTEPCRQKMTRQSVSKIDKERLVKAYNNSEDYLKLATQLDISHSAARNIIYKYRKYGEVTFGKHGGHRKPMINDEIGEHLIQYVEEKPQSTLREMKLYIQETKKINMSESTISRFLNGKLITLKKIKSSVQEKNSDHAKNLRFEYVNRFIREGWRMSQCIYIDEIGFNLWTGRQLGRSKKGTPVNIVVPTRKGKNMSLVMAISKNGPLHFKLHGGCLDHLKYQSFITELSNILPGTGYYLIQDNARIHTNTFSKYSLINLPPYSPFLNPIEAFFAKFKRDIRTKITNHSDMLSISQNQRETILKTTIETVAAKEEYKDMRNYYRHIKTFFVDCLLKADIFGD